MSPLIIVGILISTTVADVSHVLQGSAHPPADPKEINGLVAAKSGNSQDFWWMDSNSPFKEAYEYYKKCSSKGNCLPSNNVLPEGDLKPTGENLFGPIDVKNNPFLNGQYGSGSISSSFASPAGSKTSGVSTTFHSGVNVDISNNPFLKGQFATAGKSNIFFSKLHML